MKIRKLQTSEVTFTIELLEEDTPVRGNVSSSDDDEFDKQVEDELLERLDRGDITAWCCLKVTATWNGLTGDDYLGCVSFAEGSTPFDHWELANDHGMKQQALDDLQATLQAQADKLDGVIIGK